MRLIARNPAIACVRSVRKRAQPPLDILENSATFSDVSSAILNPATKLPYPENEVRQHLEKTSKELLKERNKEKYGKKKTSSVMVFDHIPIEDQAVLLFPGQGAQFIGMGKNLLDCPQAKQVFDEASEYLSYDVAKLCAEGPSTKLDQTLYCQPTVFISSIAALEKLKATEPEIVDHITDVAGFSVGEFAALVAGGVLSFKDALKIVKIRAEAMHECAQLIRSGMATIRVNASSKLDDALRDARDVSREAGEMEVCEVANYLFCGVRVIGGSETCLRYLEDNQKQYNIQVIKRLAVSAAFHTRQMKGATDRLQKALAECQLQKATCNIYSNYTGAVHSAKKGEIRSAIVKQVTHPVKWEQIQQVLYRKHQNFAFPRFIEVGPGRQLGSMLLQTSKKVYKHYEHFF